MQRTKIQDELLEEQIQRQLREEAGKAKFNAENQRITSRDQLLMPLKSLHESGKALINKVDITLQMRSNQDATEKGVAYKNEEEERLNKGITVKEEHAFTLRKNATHHNKNRGLMRGLLYACGLLLTIGDSTFNRSGFEVLFHLTYIESYVGVLSLACVLAIFSHYGIPNHVLKVKDESEQSRRLIAYMAGFVLVFLFLGYVRVSNQPMTTKVIVEILAYTLVSTVLFLGATKIGIYLYRTKLTHEMRQQIEAAKKLEINQAEIKEDKVALQNLRTNWQAHEAFTMALNEYGSMLKENIKNETKSAFFDAVKIAFNNKGTDVDPNIFVFNEYPFSFEETAKPSPSSVSSLTAVLIATVMACSLFSCADEKPKGEVAMIVAIDNSFYQETPPNSTELMRFSGLATNLWQGDTYIGLTKISDVDYEVMYEHTLEGQDRMFSNVEQRQTKVDSFSIDVGQSLNKVLPPSGADLKHSIIYRNIARNALKLRGMNYKRRYLLVWSDLQHHEKDISFYNAKGLKLLKQNTDSLEHMFLRQVPIDSLTGVHIIFIHKIINHEGNENYVLASNFFSELFRKKGSTVEISASLPNP